MKNWILKAIVAAKFGVRLQYHPESPNRWPTAKQVSPTSAYTSTSGMKRNTANYRCRRQLGAPLYNTCPQGDAGTALR